MKESYRKIGNLVGIFVMIGVFHLVSSVPEAFAKFSAELIEENGNLVQGITVLAVIGFALKMAYLFTKEEDEKK